MTTQNNQQQQQQAPKPEDQENKGGQQQQQTPPVEKPGDQQQQQQPVVKTAAEYETAAETAFEAYEKETDPAKKADLFKQAREAQKAGKDAAAKESEAAAKAAKAKADADKKGEKKLEIKLPEGSKLTQADLDEISAKALAKGLSADQAQMLVDERNDAVNKATEKLMTDFTAKKAAWAEEAVADEEIGGGSAEAFQANAELTKRVTKKFGSDAFIDQLNKTGFGNHPEFVRFCLRVGKAMSSQDFVEAPNQGGPAKPTRAQRMYPSMQKK